MATMATKSQDETHNKETHSNSRSPSKLARSLTKTWKPPQPHKTYQDQIMDGQSDQHKEC